MDFPDAKALLILISAPSGAGKTTVCQNLIEKHPNIVRAVTCTTRQPREGEQHGKDYYFLSPEAFEEKVQAGMFLEHAEVYGRRYGTLKSEVVDWLGKGTDVLLNIDVQGAASLRQEAQTVDIIRDSLVTVFLTTRTFGELEARLKNRGTDSEGERDKRIKVAREEVARWQEFDYLLISSSYEGDVRRMEVIIESEKMKRERIHPPDFH